MLLKFMLFSVYHEQSLKFLASGETFSSCSIRKLTVQTTVKKEKDVFNIFILGIDK